MPETQAIDAPAESHARSESPSNPSTSPASWIALIIAFISILILIIFCYGLALTRQMPEWWADSELHAIDIDARAGAVERGLSNAMSQPMPRGTPWTIEISQDDANAWIQGRLPMWIANQGRSWPQHVTSLRVVFHEGRAGIAALVERDRQRPQAIGVSFRPRLDREGGVHLLAAKTHLGDLTVPGFLTQSVLSEVIDELERAGDDQVDLLGILQGRVPLLSPAEVRLDDGRVTHIARIDLKPGSALITFQRPQDD